MTRIGFAFNQKPDDNALSTDDAADTPRPDEEPPSRHRDSTSRSTPSASTAGATAVSTFVEPSAPSATSAVIADEFAEWDSPETIAAVERALSAFGEVVPLEATPDFPDALRRAQPAIVFNIAEGLVGVNREAHVPAICEFYGIPYSGSDPFTLSLCLDKARAKEILAYHGVPTAAFALVRNAADLDALRPRLAAGARSRANMAPSRRPLRFPLFAKPVHEGSSKGITEQNFCATLVQLEDQVEMLLETYRQPVIVEEFLPGAEFTCAVLGNDEDARVLPIVAMNFSALPEGAIPIYGFEAKWIWDRPENPLEIFECPARIDAKLRAAIESVTLDAYRVLGCRDWSRIDVRLDAAGVPNVVEVNPLPGILPNPEDNSCFPKAARAAGLSYDRLIQSCMVVAAQRQNVTLPLGIVRDVRRAMRGPNVIR